MPETDELRRVMTEMAKEGRLQLVIAVLREEYRGFRADLEAHLLNHLLSTEEGKAEAYALQGSLKGLHRAIAQLRELGGLQGPPQD